MTAKSSANEFNVIVIGSGMGGMTTAATLSTLDHGVLLLEQAQTIGGLPHTFTRDGFPRDVGLHYCGTFGHDLNTRTPVPGLFLAGQEVTSSGVAGAFAGGLFGAAADFDVLNGFPDGKAKEDYLVLPPSEWLKRVPDANRGSSLLSEDGSVRPV